MSDDRLRAELQRWHALTQVIGAHRTCECQACQQLRDVADELRPYESEQMKVNRRDEQILMLENQIEKLDNYCRDLEDTNLQLSHDMRELEAENDGLLTLIFEQAAGGETCTKYMSWSKS